MNRLLLILNVLQFGAILVLTNPTEADHQKFLAEKMGGGVLNATSDVAAVAVTASDATSTSAVAAVAAVASATTTKAPRCEYKDVRLLSLCRQGDKVVTVGLLKNVYYVGDKFD